MIEAAAQGAWSTDRGQPIAAAVVPGTAIAPSRFRKERRRLVQEKDKMNRRLYETAVLATLRDRLRSGDVWVERSSNYRRFDGYLLPQAAVPAAAAD